MLLEHLIEGPPLSGKTTVAIGTLEALHWAGVPCVLLAPTVEWAADVARRKGLKHACMAFHHAVANPNPDWRVIAVDDVERCPDLEEGLAKLRAHLEARPGPTQLIIVRKNPPPLLSRLRDCLSTSRFADNVEMPKVLLREAIAELANKYTPSTRDVHLPGGAHVAVADEENRTSGPFASK